MGRFSFFLFARPSAAEGAGRLLDFGNTLFEYNNAPTAEQADANAFWSDWCALGEDFESAVMKYTPADQGTQRRVEKEQKQGLAKR
jgi:hypothetical protein